MRIWTSAHWCQDPCTLRLVQQALNLLLVTRRWLTHPALNDMHNSKAFGCVVCEGVLNVQMAAAADRREKRVGQLQSIFGEVDLEEHRRLKTRLTDVQQSLEKVRRPSGGVPQY